MSNQKNIVDVNYYINKYNSNCEKIMNSLFNINNNNPLMPADKIKEFASNKIIISEKKSHSLPPLISFTKDNLKCVCEDNKLMNNEHNNELNNNSQEEYILPYNNNSKKSKYIELPDKFNNSIKADSILSNNNNKYSKKSPERHDNNNEEDESVSETLYNFIQHDSISLPSFSEYSSDGFNNNLSAHDK